MDIPLPSIFDNKKRIKVDRKSLENSAKIDNALSSISDSQRVI